MNICESLHETPLSLIDHALPESMYPEHSAFQNLESYEERRQILDFCLNSTGITKVHTSKATMDNSIQLRKKEKVAKISNTRWGRSEDKFLFQTIREMEQLQIITLDELLHPHPNTNINDYEGIHELCSKVNWRSSAAKLLARIKTLCNPEFSFREMRKLKKIIKRIHNQEEIDYNDLIYEFPGKTIHILQDTIRSLLESSNQKV
ncbi:unnamed protein product [Moneuplotes crassus]|uniref:Uncharacterized protein n=1 Tax=Euplotes crassus TaxID=5936 RepID=A0AAD1XKS9_EUPCR|nr:unnamed protein product [Moneuplotes crassus]